MVSSGRLPSKVVTNRFSWSAVSRGNSTDKVAREESDIPGGTSVLPTGSDVCYVEQQHMQRRTG
jgi:hypothetical protein